MMAGTGANTSIRKKGLHLVDYQHRRCIPHRIVENRCYFSTGLMNIRAAYTGSVDLKARPRGEIAEPLHCESLSASRRPVKDHGRWEVDPKGPIAFAVLDDV